MSHTFALLALALFVVVCLSSAAAVSQQEAPGAGAAPAPAKDDRTDTPAALNFTMKGIDGKNVDLAQYRGKVVMIVNVASKCGLTPQYEQLQALHEKHHEQGLVILGFPANEFGNQEPGSNDEIQTFCTENYAVKFPMFSKVVVKGEGTCPLYKFLTSSDTNPKFAGEIKWNFTKFLIARDGTVVNRFEPRTTPNSPEVISAIEAELAKKAS